MGRIVSLVNPKGGTGKSTLALCLGSIWKNTAIIDLDTQGSIWSWFQERQSLPKQGEDKGPAVEFYGIDEPTGETLEEYAQRFETVFIDCPGESEAGIRTRTALVYSDLVIIPVRESEFDAASLFDHLLPLLEDAQRSNEREGKIAILPVMCHVNSRPERTVARFRSLDRAVLPTTMKSRNVYKKFSGKGSTLEEYAENATRANDRIQAKAALADIREIAAQIENLLP